jgi:hypothetical protein
MDVARRARIDHLETTMFRSLKPSRSKRRCVQLLCVLAGWPVLSLTTNARAEAGQEQASEEARHGSAVPRGYRVINVVDGANYRATNFNARGQIGVSFYTGNYNPDQLFFMTAHRYATSAPLAATALG